MPNQNHPDKTMKEKELKEKEKIMELLGLPTSTMPLIHGHKRSPLLEMNTTKGSNLIPRVINNNILVYAITISNADIHMDSLRPRYYNIQHGIRASDVVNNNIDLHTAASCGTGAREVVHRNKELLWHMDSEGNLPLHLAVENGHKEVAFFLVSEYPQGAYSLNRSNISPLYLAVARNHLDLVKVMFRELAKDENTLPWLMNGKSIIHLAILNNNQEMVQTILKSQPDLLKSTNEEGLTPLSYAAYNDFIDIVGNILEKYPKAISYPNKDSSNPYHKASLGGHVEVLKMLHSKCKDPKWLKAGDEKGQTVLHIAAKERGNKLKHVVFYLLSLEEGKELINRKDEDRCTPFKLAISCRNLEVKALFEACLSTN